MPQREIQKDFKPHEHGHIYKVRRLFENILTGQKFEFTPNFSEKKNIIDTYTSPPPS